MKITSKLIVLLFSISSFAFAEKPKFAYEKTKTIYKSYNTSANATTSITNMNGNINVYLTDQSSVSIQVNITVSGKNESKVTERLNGIDVFFNATSNKVEAKTTIEGKTYTGNNNLSYEINYIVKIPKNGNVNLSNKYGNIYADKINGNTFISCKYGSINFGSLDGNKNEINLGYSQNSTINSVDNLDLDSQYSELAIQKSAQISTSGNYNTLDFKNCSDLKLNSNYTKVYSDYIGKVVISGNYLTVKLGEIGTSFDIISNYSDIRCTNTIKTNSININGNYSNIKIYCEPNSNFDFTVSTKYASFKPGTNITFTKKSEKESSGFYSGRFNSGGKNKVNATTNYGNIEFIKK
jgi:hypothetical protein